ncbi:MAG: transglutaminase domain-containing protein [Deltaproteobacteria bacterium]|nr:transglutaminase domain-containing protein [Deltaproteobacteria bacterium]
MSETASLSGPSRRGSADRIALPLFLLLILCLLFLPRPSLAIDRRAAVTVKVNLNAPSDAGRVKLWIPYPMSDENQDVSGVEIGGNYSAAGIYREGKFGNAILFAEWNAPGGERTLTYMFRVSRRQVATKRFPEKELPFSKEEFEKYLSPTSLGSTGGAAREYAEKITAGKTTALAKARAIYDWIVENMHRDPDVKGCGLGEVDMLLRKPGGKCADIHSVFVTLARAAGVPAREVFGIRLPKGKEGDMTKAQHCWAEFYLPGSGWVVVDPADVRKAILEKKISLEEAAPLREHFFGAVDENRIAFGTGRDLRLNPPQAGEPLNYFMYPYAEADGKPLNEDLYGFNLGYAVEFREL